MAHFIPPLCRALQRLALVSAAQWRLGGHDIQPQRDKVPGRPGQGGRCSLGWLSFDLLWMISGSAPLRAAPLLSTSLIDRFIASCPVLNFTPNREALRALHRREEVAARQAQVAQATANWNARICWRKPPRTDIYGQLQPQVRRISRSDICTVVGS